MKSIGMYGVGVLCVCVMLAGTVQATLVANYSLEETDLSTSRTIANSVATSGWGDGTAVGTLGSDIRTPRAGVVGNAFYLDADGKITTGDQLSANGDWTMSGWSKVVYNNVRAALFCQFTGGTGSMYFMAADSTVGYKARLRIVGDSTAPTVDLQSSSALNDSQWHYFMATRSGDTFSLYVDEVLVDSVTLTGVSLTTGSNLCIGNLSATQSVPTGAYLDELQVYDHAVPEPATLLLLGLGSVLTMRRRR